jgi:ferredoxin
MKVKIIEDECTGCEECVEAVPDVFEMSEDGELAKVKVETVPAELESEVEQQAEDCPAEAITVE